MSCGLSGFGVWWVMYLVSMVCGWCGSSEFWLGLGSLAGLVVWVFCLMFCVVWLLLFRGGVLWVGGLLFSVCSVVVGGSGVLAWVW